MKPARHLLRTFAVPVVVCAAVLVAVLVVPVVAAQLSPTQQAKRASKLARHATQLSDQVLAAVAGAKPGPQGDAGSKGSAGDHGQDGNAGLAGQGGADGLAGNKGDTGAPGANGANGANGATIIARVAGSTDQNTCSNACNGPNTYPLTTNQSWHQDAGQALMIVVELSWTEQACDTGGNGDPALFGNVNVDGGNNGGFLGLDPTALGLGGAGAHAATLQPIVLPAAETASDHTLSVSVGDNCQSGGHFTIHNVRADVVRLA